jgi:hypothetical protein
MLILDAEILGRILSLCVNSPDPQACHKKYSVCIERSNASEKKRKDDCKDSAARGQSKSVDDCLYESGGIQKMAPEVLIGCMKE